MLTSDGPYELGRYTTRTLVSELTGVLHQHRAGAEDLGFGALDDLFAGHILNTVSPVTTDDVAIIYVCTL